MSDPIDKTLSPLRSKSSANSIDELVKEQLEHFSITPDSEHGKQLSRVVRSLYQCHHDSKGLWDKGLAALSGLSESDTIARFNAQKFLCFQIAKLLDNLQQPFRETYQNLNYSTSTQLSKGPYPIFDNVTAVFSATPVITRTATYIFACAEWISDAFHGKEFMLEIYSRLLNPTSIALANHIVSLEAGPYANQYLAWNFNSGMAAIDATLSHILGRDDILITNRNIYGGAWQLIRDWFAKEQNLNIGVRSFDGLGVESLRECFEDIQQEFAERIAAGHDIFLYLESPCNPHGDILDVPALCKFAHQHGVRVILDATVGTPFLVNPLQREDESERPDFLIHSYTKDLTGTGSTIAGCVIGKNEDMFLPKGFDEDGLHWANTMFWNVYYVKGAFLNADGAYDVMQGMKTLQLRMLQKCITTVTLSKFLESHPNISVRSSSAKTSASADNRRKLMRHGLPAPLLTFDIENISHEAFHRFFDMLAPAFGHMISLGQSNTIVSCPALTTHSELDDTALQKAGISATTIRIAVGDESVLDLIQHLKTCTRSCFGEEFSQHFMHPEDTRELIRKTYLSIHESHVERELMR